MNDLVQVESSGNPDAVSPAGAEGLFQIMPETAANPGFGVKPLSTGKDVKAASVEEQREFATSYLNALLDRYDGNIRHALAAYNAGPGTVDKWLKGEGKLPAETIQYIKKFEERGLN